MKKLFVIICSFYFLSSFGQDDRKEYSKDIALYRIKFFIAETLGANPEPRKLIIDPLAASKSSEITSVYYESEQIKGLSLGFFDDYWAPGAFGYQGYGFKNLTEKSAIGLLDKIELIIDEGKKFLNASDNENNIFFSHEDLIVIVYREGPLAGRIRIKWNDFDGEWENTAFRRTKRRFEKSIE